MNGVAYEAPIDSQGNFWPWSTPANCLPRRRHTRSLMRMGDADFSSVSDNTTTTLTVQPVSTPASPIEDFAWQYAKSLPEMPVAPPVGAVLNGKINVIVGGLSNYSYDPSSNTWSTLASIPQPGIDAGGAAVVNSKLYVIGFGSTPGTEIYNPASNSWTTGPPMPMPRYDGAVVEADGKIYAIGGDDGHGNFVGTVEAYDPATNTWATCRSVPTPRAGWRSWRSTV